MARQLHELTVDEINIMIANYDKAGVTESPIQKFLRRSNTLRFCG